jgi:hypothetical protein
LEKVFPFACVNAGKYEMLESCHKLLQTLILVNEATLGFTIDTFFLDIASLVLLNDVILHVGKWRH